MEGGAPVQEPVLQCVQIKSMSAKAGDTVSERYRVIFSDTENFIQSMLATRKSIRIQPHQLLLKLCRDKLHCYRRHTEERITGATETIPAEYGEGEENHHRPWSRGPC